MTLCALMSRCSRAGACTAETALQRSRPMRVASAGAEHGLLAQHLFERPAAHELHPEPDVVADLLGAVNRDDVAVANAGEQAAFGNDERGRARRRHCGGREKLERDFAIEARIPRAVDLAERALADPLDELKVTPRRRHAVDTGERRDDLQVLDERTLSTVDAPIQQSPSRRPFHRESRRRSPRDVLHRSATLHLLHEANQRALRRLSCGVRRRLPECLASSSYV